MSLAGLGRRVERLERRRAEAEQSESFLASVFAVEQKINQQRRATLAMMDFARSLAGTLDQPPPRTHGGTAASDGSPGAAVRGARRAGATRSPEPEPEPLFDPSFGGRIIGAHGGLASSAEALRALPPEPPPEPAPPVRPERWPWEHWGVPPPPGWTEEHGNAGPANETDGAAD